MPTLGAGFKTKEVEYTEDDGNKGKMKLNLWDTAGQEKFDALTKLYFKNAEAAIIVYDVTNELSFEKA
jgi:small GTP-binding protein